LLVCLSRAALLFGCVAGVPAARPDGLGALVTGSVGVPATVVTWLIGVAAATAMAVLAGQAAWVPAVGAVLAVLACLWLVRRCVRRLGGVTGDVLGALVEVCATVLLVTATAWPPGR
jgi:adenosylcobinamide-GDP ribazoletransferase